MSDQQFWSRVMSFAAQLDRASYYDVLGLRPDADADAIKAAFWNLAPRLHPDRHTREPDPKRQRALTLLYARLREAYDILSDPQSRRDYDEGLRGGRKRFKFDAPSRSIPLPERPKTPKARRFYEMAQQRLSAGDARTAKMYFEMGLQIEPESRALQHALERLEGGDTKATTATPAGKGGASSGVPGAERVGSATGALRALMGTPAPSPATRAKPRPRSPTRERSAAAVFAGLVRTGPIAEVVGIDFGTSYSSVSVGVGDKVYMVPDAYGRTLHPSVVHYETSGLSKSGWDARELLVAKPRQTVASPKRLLGRAFSDPTIAGMLHGAAYKVMGGPNDSILVDVEGRQYVIPQICAQVVGYVRDVAEKRLGRRIEKAVMSVPVTYGDHERSELGRVAKLAGIEVVGFVEEPVAAAMAYGFGQGKSEVVAVYDFGGGTFDFTVLDISNYSFRVLTRGGDSWLGGDDFDLAVAGAVANAIWRKTNVEVRNRQVEWQRLLFACEHTKRLLSILETAPILVERLLEHPQPMNLNQPLPRSVLEKLCRELVERSLAICTAAMSQIGLEPSDMDQVVVSGGVSRMPFVRRRLSEYFKRDIEALVNPDEAIGLGAGFRAAQLSRFAVTGVGKLE